MSLFKLNLFSVMIVAALLLSTASTMAQFPASSPTKSQPPRKAISPSPASSPPQPSDAAAPEFIRTDNAQAPFTVYHVGWNLKTLSAKPSPCPLVVLLSEDPLRDIVR
jgi:hypothetical protein